MKSILDAIVLSSVLACGGCATLSDQTGTSGTTPAEPPRTTASGPVEIDDSRRGVLPVGQQLDVRLQDSLSSATSTPEQEVEATTVVDLEQGGEVLVPAGSTVRGLVTSVDPAGRLDRRGRLTLSFDEITVRGREIPITALPTQAFESGGIREEAAKVGAAGAVGAIVGGIIDGVRGAVIGAAIGSGGVLAATEGKDIELPAGTIVRLRLDAPADVR